MIERLRNADVSTPPPIVIRVDDRAIEALPGESLVAALLASGCTTFKRSPRADSPRGPFCLMGVCQDCLVEIDGRPALACQEVVRAGMVVRLLAASSR